MCGKKQFSRWDEKRYSSVWRCQKMYNGFFFVVNFHENVSNYYFWCRLQCELCFVFCVLLDMIISFSICPFRWCSFRHSIMAFFWMHSNSQPTNQPVKCSLCSQCAVARVQRNHTNFENSRIQLCFIRYHKYFVWLECDIAVLYRWTDHCEWTMEILTCVSTLVRYSWNVCTVVRPPIECIYAESFSTGFI